MNEEIGNKSFFSFAKRIFANFGPTEKILFSLFAGLMVLSTITMLLNINGHFLVEVPAKGGTLREGFVGSPRFLNPILAVSDTDKAIVSLVYSGLLRPTLDGGYEPDLAESYSVSDDGLSYYFKIRPDATFQDGKSVTTEDIMFTIDKALDPVVKSNKRSNWEGVSIEKVNDKEIIFNLKKPYSPFLESLTLGILPKHLWQETSSEEFAFSKWNIEPIGSGAYKINDIQREGDGIPTEISLKSFNKYALGEAKISNIDIKFLRDNDELESAYSDGLIDTAVFVNPEENNPDASQSFSSVMPRIFGAFFNQNHAPLLSNIEVRKALDMSVDKDALVRDILSGGGIVISGPIPQESKNISTTTPKTAEEKIESAKALLASNGWKPNADGILEKKGKTASYTLKFSISTSDVLSLKKTAEVLAETWRKLGAIVDVKIFEASDLNTNVIKTRNYDVLLFGEVIGRETDLYPFWHSSQRNEPGLNISLYANISVDKLLEDERSAKTEEEKKEKLEAIETEIKKDVPAVFLYAPKYSYRVGNNIKNVSGPSTGTISDRFLSIGDWYINTIKIWKIFQKD